MNKDEQIKRLKMMLDDAHATIAQLQSRSLDVERWKEEYELANDRVFQLENELKKVTMILVNFGELDETILGEFFSY